MTGIEYVAVLGTGFVAGIVTTTVGVATLVSFPVLVALGLPPVVAAATNSVGLVPGAASGSWGYRAHFRRHPGVTRSVWVTCAVGGCVGGVLLLALPPGVFEAIVPWLILVTCVLVGAQPRVSAYLRGRHGEDMPAPRLTMSPVTTAFATLSGVYAGYFGAGSGVMMMAVLGFGLDLEFRVVNALKTLAVFAGNGVAAVVFVMVADLDWPVVGLLALGSVFGGYVGSRIGDRLPAALLRAGIVAMGVTAAVLMLT